MSNENEELQEFQKLVAEPVAGRSRPSRRPIEGEVAKASKSGPQDLAGSYVQYAANGPGYIATTKTINVLPSGCYSVRVVNDMLTFVPQRIVTDRLLRLPDSKSDMVISEVDKFWQLKPKFEEFGFSHKRGYLMWGPPGSGKTGTVALIIEDMVKNGGLVILGDTGPGMVAQQLSRLREIEPDRRVVLVLEDLDAIVERHGESDLLSLLDGEGQIDNVVFIATTNYPERLDPRIVNRPSRFDRVVKIGMPSLAARKMYVASRLGDDFADLELWAQETKGLSIAHIKELIVSVFCLETDFKSALTRVQTMKNAITNDELSKPIGLTKLPGSQNGEVKEAASTGW